MSTGIIAVNHKEKSSVMSEKMRVGWIGTGVMGHSMAANLLAADFPLTVYSRTRDKAEDLIEKGAEWADSPKDVAIASDIVFSIVGYPADVESVILGDWGALKGLRKGGIVCDMTTSSPELARKIDAAARAVGCFSLDAPVTGGDTGARAATLSIFVGGDESACKRAMPCFETMGKKILYCGAAGQGQQAKLANQVAIAGVMFSVCESLLYAQEAGLDVRAWLDLVDVGAAGSVAMANLGKRILDMDFQPGFFIEHFVKDLGLCLAECRRMQLVLPGTTLAEEFYRMMQAQGEGRLGTQNLINCLARLSGKEWGRAGEK